MRTQVLLPWTTMNILNTFTQGVEGWLDLGDVTDVVCWIDVAGMSLPLTTVSFESAPTFDDSFFQPLGPPVKLTSGQSTVVFKSVRAASTTPLSRWLRCKVSGGGTGTSMIRVRACPMRQARFAPPQIPGCVLWLRSDLGASGFTPIGWNDQSFAGDPNENLVPAGGFSSPTLSTTDPNYANNPSWNTSTGATLVSSAAWATPLLQPSTWIVVAWNDGTGAGNQFLVDADDATTGQSIQYNPATTTLQIFANGSSVSTTQSWNTTTAALLGEWNGASSNIYFNNFTTPIASGTVGGGTAGSQGSMTLMAKNISLGGGSFWLGSIAEVIAYSGILSATAKAQLRLYLNNRYNLAIT